MLRRGNGTEALERARTFPVAVSIAIAPVCAQRNFCAAEVAGTSARSE